MRRAPDGGHCATCCSTISRAGSGDPTLAAQAVRRGHQHDRPLGGAERSWRSGTRIRPRRRRRSPPSRSATATIRWCSTNGSRSRRASRAPQSVERVEALMRAPGLLDRQPQPRPRADRHLLDGQPDRIPPRGRRRLPAVRRHGAGRRKAQPAGRGAAGDGAALVAFAGAGAAGEGARGAAQAGRRRRGSRPICATSSSARWPDAHRAGVRLLVSRQCREHTFPSSRSNFFPAETGQAESSLIL